jgi:pentatricopeptide repeat protein
MTDRGLEPNKYTYTAVLSSFAKSGDPDQAETILNEMMEAYEDGIFDLKPDTISFSAVIDGWAKLSHVDKPEAAIRALALLRRMKELESKGMGPNARTYTSVFTALAKSGTWEACEKAQDLLKEMEGEYKKGRHWLKPTVIQYNAVLLAFARSPRADKALEGASFFSLMERHHDPDCRPDTISYNTLLLACANAFGNQELKTTSFQVAARTFQESIKLGADATSKVQPTSTTFAHFCKAARRLLTGRDQEKRHAVLEETLRLCREKGMLSQVVIQQVQMSCCNEAEWQDRAGVLADHIKWKDGLTPSRVPNAWVQNARR